MESGYIEFPLKTVKASRESILALIHQKIGTDPKEEFSWCLEQSGVRRELDNNESIYACQSFVISKLRIQKIKHSRILSNSELFGPVDSGLDGADIGLIEEVEGFGYETIRTNKKQLVINIPEG